MFDFHKTFNTFFFNSHNTIGENIIATIKMRNYFCYPLKIAIFEKRVTKINLHFDASNKSFANCRIN